jgi:hypothetical protein
VAAAGPAPRRDPTPSPGEAIATTPVPTVGPAAGDVRRRVARLLLLRTLVVSVVLGL